MANKESQHFVPKFLMRAFSCFDNKKTISLYNTTNNFFIINKASIDGQCQDSFFYGKDLNTENMLALLETKTSPVFRNIITSNQLPKWGTDDYANMHIFTIVQSLRTKSTQDEWNDSFDMKMKAIFKRDQRIGDLVYNYKFKIVKAASYAVNKALDLMQITYDLECKLLINESDTLFILSDNPVVKYNQFLKNKGLTNGISGLGSMGLQLILPISPRHALLFYDPLVYKVGERRYKFIKFKNKTDVDLFNKLQILNCDKNIYFNEFVTEDYINYLIKACPKKNELPKNILHEYKAASGKESYIISIYGQEINLKTSIPFCSENKFASKYSLGNKVAHIRRLAKAYYDNMKEDDLEANETDAHLGQIFKKI